MARSDWFFGPLARTHLSPVTIEITAPITAVVRVYVDPVQMEINGMKEALLKNGFAMKFSWEDWQLKEWPYYLRNYFLGLHQLG